MVTFNPSGRVLIALFDLTRVGENIDLFSVAEGAGLNLYRTLAELTALGERGLVDAGRLRLTLPGMAVAVSLDRRAHGRRQAPATDAPKAHVATTTRVVPLVPRAVAQQSEGPKQQVFTRDLVA